MTLETFLNKIGLPEDTMAAVLAYDVPDDESARLLSLYDSDYTSFSGELCEKYPENPHLAFLAYFCRWALESLSVWYEKGFPEEIAIDTFRDITIWSNRFRERNGKLGLMEWHWFYIHKNAGLFRLGRLQFEPKASKWDITLPDGTELKASDPVLSVHIPRGERLTAENIKESFDLSKTFFPKYFGRSYDTYVCRSWLLSPALGDMISPESGIAEFRRYFHVFDEELGYSQAEDYVFVMSDPDKSTYPENTSLQRNLKKFLMNGGTMGMGMGVAKY